MHICVYVYTLASDVHDMERTFLCYHFLSPQAISSLKANPDLASFSAKGVFREKKRKERNFFVTGLVLFWGGFLINKQQEETHVIHLEKLRRRTPSSI